MEEKKTGDKEEVCEPHAKCGCGQCGCGKVLAAIFIFVVGALIGFLFGRMPRCGMTGMQCQTTAPSQMSQPQAK